MDDGFGLKMLEEKCPECQRTFNAKESTMLCAKRLNPENEGAIFICDGCYKRLYDAAHHDPLEAYA